MNRKTTVVLGAIAIGLFAYITVIDRQALTTTEMQGRHSRLLERFSRARVDRIVIERNDETTTLVLDRPEDGSLGEWHMESPVEGLADEDAVGAFIGSLEWSDARRVFTAQEGDLARFGLVSPRIRITLTMGREEVVVLVGDDEEVGGGVYLTVDGGETIQVAGLDTFEALDHDGAHYQTKRLIVRGLVTATSLGLYGEETLVFSQAVASDGSSDANSDASPDASSETDTVQDAGEVRWLLGGRWASTAAVDEVLAAITGLEAESYPEGELGEVGLTVRVERPFVLANDGVDGQYRVVVWVGEACDTSGEVRLQVEIGGESGPLACVLSSTLDPLRREGDGFVERRPITVSDLDVQAVEIERGGRSLLVARGEGDQGEVWSGTVPVDAEAIREWLRDVRRHRARSVRTIEGLDLETVGLDSPEATLTVRGLLGVQVLHIGAETAEGLFVRRGNEDAVLVVDPNLGALIDPSGIRFRPRTLIDAQAVSSLSIQRGGVTERLQPAEGNDWEVIEPLQAKADRSGVRALIETLQSLSALRFVGDVRPEQGLAEPALVARFEADDVAYILRLGAIDPQEGGSFATLEGGEADADMVMVLSPEIRLRLQRPLIAGDIASVPSYEIDAIRIVRGTTTIDLHQDGGHFVSDDGPVDDETMVVLTQAISRMRVQGHHYGSAAAADGFEPAQAVLRLELAEGSDRGEVLEFQIGAPDGHGHIHVRLPNLEVDLLAPMDAVTPILEFQL